MQLVVPGGLVVTNTSIGRLEDFGAFDWISLVHGPGALTVPAGQEHDLVDQLLDMPAIPRLELPEELQLEEVRSRPVAHLTIRSPQGVRWHVDRLQGEVSFEYMGTMVKGSSGRWAIVERERGRCIIRDRAFEDQAWGELQQHGFRRLIDQRRGRHDVEIAARDLGPAVRVLINMGWMIQADGKHVRQPGEMKFRIQSGIDWFELHADVDFQGARVTFPELLSALARGDSTVRLDDGSLGIIPEEWLRKFGLLGGLGVAHDDHVRFSAHQVALLDALLATTPDVDYDEKYTQVRDRFQNKAGIATVHEPEGFHGELRGYQREGLGWLEFLKDFQLGGCLADDMGLGKTVQLLALLLAQRRSNTQPIPSLVVVPKSLLFNWQQECERFTPELRVLEYTGLERAPLRDKFNEYDIILTTYGTLRRDILVLQRVSIRLCRAGRSANDQKRRLAGGQGVAAVARQSSRRPERHADRKPSGRFVVDFRVPQSGHAGPQLGLQVVCSRRRRPRRPQIAGRRIAAVHPPADKKAGRQRTARKIRTDHLLRYVGKTAQAVRRTARSLPRARCWAWSTSRGWPSRRCTCWKRCCGCGRRPAIPRCSTRRRTKIRPPSSTCYARYLEELIDEGHKTLVFSQFTSMLAIVRKHLDQRNIVYEYLDGQTRDRKQTVERFQTDPQCGVFLISLKAGGLGLNLTAADYVFLLDPWWNPAVEMQAIDRAHRVGQTRQVFAYRLICKRHGRRKDRRVAGEEARPGRRHPRSRQQHPQRPDGRGFESAVVVARDHAGWG